MLTLLEAIEIATELQINDLPLPRHREWEAVQLLIEAGKRIQTSRSYPGRLAAYLLPGERQG